MSPLDAEAARRELRDHIAEAHRHVQRAQDIAYGQALRHRGFRARLSTRLALNRTQSALIRLLKSS